MWRHYPRRWTSWAKSLRVQFWGTNTWGNLTRKSLCQQSSVEFGEKNIQAQSWRQSYVLFSCGKKRRQKHRRSYVWCGFGSCNAHAEQVVWSSDQMDTLRRSRTPRAVLTATGEVQINEEAQVFFVHDLDLFVTVQLLDETPAVLSLRMLCSEHGCSYEPKNG